MFDYSATELATIDGLLEPKLGWAQTRYADAHQLALDSTRLLSCSQDRIDEYKGKGFFRRVWYRLSGKTTEIQQANQADLLAAQKIGWRYLQLLNERDLLQAQSIIAVRNNLLTLAAKEEETRREVARLADRVYERFTRLEERVDKLEVAQQIHSWLLTVGTNDYDQKYPPHLRMLRVVNDFSSLKAAPWTITELKYLQSALRETGIEWRKEVSLEDFVNELISEIETSSFEVFERLIIEGSHPNLGAAQVLDEVSAPSYDALFEIAGSYTTSSATIDVLRDQLSVSRGEAIRRVLKRFMEKQGIDLGAKMQLRWLGIELLDCMQLARALAQQARLNPQQDAHPIEEPPSWTVGVGRDPDAAAAFGDLAPYLAGVLREADQGDADAQFEIGMCYLTGEGAPKDRAKAQNWFMKAAEQHHADAEYAIGRERERIKDFAAARVWYQRSAERGCPNAQFRLARFLDLGLGGRSDTESSLEWFRRAANQGHAEALSRLRLREAETEDDWLPDD